MKPRIRPTILFALLLPVLAGPASGSLIDALLERIERSEFIFGQPNTNTPFPAIAWLDVKDYGETGFNLNNGPVRFDQSVFSQALMTPVWVGLRDMVVAGESVVYQQIDFTAPLASRRKVTSVMPMLAWLRQAGPRGQVGLFVAPEFVDGGHYAGVPLNDQTLYTGLLGTYWQSDDLAWIYGGVAMFTDGGDLLLPYVGLFWHVTKEWNLALIAPWPSVNYSPNKKFMVQLGMAPSGATLASTQDGQRIRVGYDAWDLTLSAHRQITSFLWVSAGVGWSGFGSFKITTDGETSLKSNLSRTALWTLRLEVRPPESDKPKQRGWLPRP